MPQPRRVLVLDDNDGNRLLLEVALKMQGYTCDSVGTGKAALEKTETTDYELILIDVNLPDMNGLDVASRIRQKNKETILIAATIDDDDQTIQRAENAGCNVFMIKPFDLDQLLNFLSRLDPETMCRTCKIQVVDNTALSRFEL